MLNDYINKYIASALTSMSAISFDRVFYIVKE